MITYNDSLIFQTMDLLKKELSADRLEACEGCYRLLAHEAMDEGNEFSDNLKRLGDVCFHASQALLYPTALNLAKLKEALK